MNWFKSFFYLQKNDRQGVILMVLLIVIALLLVFYAGGNNTSEMTATADSAQQQSADDNYNGREEYYTEDGRKITLFAFDPNTADSTQLKKLGLQDWQIRSIYHYRAKGGVYRRPSDFARLYGLTKKQYETLAPYIRIADDFRPASDFYGNEGYESGGDRNAAYSPDSAHRQTQATAHHSQKLRPGQQISLNDADTTELMKVPGIGSGYARAIVNYRNRLGGYANVKQVLEIGGVPESALPFLTLASRNGASRNANNVVKINVNKLSVNQLRRHPYLNFYQARDIYEYRRLHGPLKSLSPLRNTGNFTEADLQRLEPYISFE